MITHWTSFEKKCSSCVSWDVGVVSDVQVSLCHPLAKRNHLPHISCRQAVFNWKRTLYLPAWSFPCLIPAKVCFCLDMLVSTSRLQYFSILELLTNWHYAQSPNIQTDAQRAKSKQPHPLPHSFLHETQKSHMMSLLHHFKALPFSKYSRIPIDETQLYRHLIVNPIWLLLL